MEAGGRIVLEWTLYLAGVGTVSHLTLHIGCVGGVICLHSWAERFSPEEGRSNGFSSGSDVTQQDLADDICDVV